MGGAPLNYKGLLQEKFLKATQIQTAWARILNSIFTICKFFTLYSDAAATTGDISPCHD